MGSDTRLGKTEVSETDASETAIGETAQAVSAECKTAMDKPDEAEAAEATTAEGEVVAKRTKASKGLQLTNIGMIRQIRDFLDCPMSELQRGARKSSLADALNKQGNAGEVARVLTAMVYEVLGYLEFPPRLFNLGSTELDRVAQAIDTIMHFLETIPSSTLATLEEEGGRKQTQLMAGLSDLGMSVACWSVMKEHFQPRVTGKRGRPANWRRLGTIVVVAESIAWQACKEGAERKDKIRAWSIAVVESLDLDLGSVTGSRERAYEALITCDLPKKKQVVRPNTRAIESDVKRWIRAAKAEEGFLRAKRANARLVKFASEYYKEQGMIKSDAMKTAKD